jgi:hypothetical protein
MATYTYKPGLGQSAAYQVSGKPFVSGGIDAQTPKPRGSAGIGPAVVNFPNVTSWVMVVNHAATDCRVGFSQNGVNGGKVSGGGSSNNYFVLDAAVNNVSTKIGPLDLKVTQLWLSGSEDVDVIAGLTYIDNSDVNNFSVSPKGANWSGSAGAQVG